MTPSEYVHQLRLVALCWSGRTDDLAKRELRAIAERAHDAVEYGDINDLMLLRLRYLRRRALHYTRSCD